MAKKIWLLILLLLLIVGGVAFYILSQPSSEKLSDKDKEDAVARLTGRKANLNPEIKTGNGTYQGKHITFSYPAKAEIYSYREQSSTKNANVLEDFSFDLRNPRLIFNMRVANTSLTTLDDDPSINLRKTRSYEYKESILTIDGKKGILFTKSDKDYEKTGFLLIGKKLYTLTVTGSTVKEVENLFNSVTSSAKIIE